MLDILLTSDLSDNFDHLHYVGCMERSIQWRHGYMHNFFPNHIKDIDLPSASQNHAQQKDSTLRQDVHLIPTLRKNNHSGKRVQVHVVHVHVVGNLELLLSRDVNLFLLISSRQANIMNLNMPIPDVLITKAHNVSRPHVAHFVPDPLKIKVHDQKTISIFFLISTRDPQGCLKYPITSFFQLYFIVMMFFIPWASHALNARVISLSFICSHISQSITICFKTG